MATAMYCPDCDDSHDVPAVAHELADRQCPVCGCALSASAPAPLPPAPAAPPPALPPLPPSGDAAFDIASSAMHDALMRMAEHESLQHDAPPPQRTEAEAAAIERRLRRSVVDETSSVLTDAAFRYRGTTYEALLGQFSPVPDASAAPAAARCYLASPPDAVAEVRAHPGAWVAVVTRGGSGFAAKAMRCQAAGASACIVINSQGATWPYTMLDGKKEGAGLTIPTALISFADGRALQARLAEGNTAAADNTSAGDDAALLVHASDATCAICQDSYALGDKVVKLPCLHVFHDACTETWFKRNPSCPNCRLSLATDAVSAQRSADRTWHTWFA